MITSCTNCKTSNTEFKNISPLAHNDWQWGPLVCMGVGLSKGGTPGAVHGKIGTQLYMDALCPEKRNNLILTQGPIQHLYSKQLLPN